MRSPLPSVSRRTRRVVVLLVAVVVLIFLLSAGVGLYTDWLWFGEVGFTRVMSTMLWTRVLLFLAFGVGMALIVAANLLIAFRLRPSYRPMSLEQQNLERYRLAVTPRFRLTVGIVAGAVGLVTGLAAQGQWRTWLLFVNSTPFGRTDPQYGRDLSFYVFEYPFWRYLVGVGFTALVLSIVGALLVHYLYGGIRLQSAAGGRLGPGVIGHISVLLGLFVALKAVSYYLDRFGLLFGYSDSTKTNGASASDVEFLLPAKNILLWIAALCAVVFIANVGLRRVLPPVMALVLLGISAIVIGGAVPAFAEQFTIKPNANDREAEYISRNIAGTRDAYGIGTIDRQQYDAKTTATTAELRGDVGTIPNARLLDPNVLSDAFTQLQKIRGFYAFNRSLDIDHYTVGGKTRDYVVGVRELDSGRLTGNQTNWINRHTVYTHGYGLVAAPANAVDNRGQPIFVSGFLDAQTTQTSEDVKAFAAENPLTQPRIYYGELIGDYSVVGKSGDRADREFDRPAAQGGDDGEQINTTYTGTGGVEVDNLGRRLLYAMYFRERNFLLSSALNDDSKVLYVRDPRARVEKVAPFLTVDGDPYPTIVNGRVKWVVDGYTTSNFFPYAQRATLREVAQDSTTGAGTAAAPRDEVNYIRNSVKATVDAYDGSVDLYAFDETDPVLRTWNKAFDGIVKPKSAIPAELAEHFRYPEDLFKVQRSLLANYHVSDPQEFFNGDDFWKVPDDPTDNDAQAQPPYYLVAQLPGQEAPTFQLTSAVTANKGDNLTALISGRYDAEGKPEIAVLELPGDAQIPGPNQAQQNMRNDTSARTDFNIINAGASRVVFGNLLTLPVGGGLLYLEPIYVRGTGETSYPRLEHVLVLFGDKAAYQPTLKQALDALFGPGATTPTTPTNPTTPPPSTSATPSPSTSATATPQAPSTAQAVAALRTALENLRSAQQRGDFAAIGQAQADLDRAIKQFDASQRSASPTPAPNPSQR